MLHRLCETGAHEHAGQQQVLRIGETRAQRDRARPRIHRDFGKFDGAGQAIIAAILQRQPHRCLGRYGATLCQRPAQRKQLGGRLLNIDIDRVEPLDHRQRFGLVRGDERPLREQRAADPPGDRRRHAGEAEVDPRGLESGARLGDRSGGLSRLRLRIDIILLADGFDLGERFEAVGAGLGSAGGGLGTGERGARLIAARAEQPGVDLIKRLPGAHQTSFGKQAALDQP